MEMLTMRSPQVAISEMKAIAESQYMPPRTSIRTWIAERLEAEQSNIEPVPGIEVGATTPGTDRQPNHKGVIVDGITA